MRNRIYTLSFIEGASVMAAELLGAKMLAPYFGSSLYVWSSILAVTLLALTSGYFFGGVLSEKKNTETRLYQIALAAAAFMVLMPFLVQSFLLLLGDVRLIPAIITAALLLLFPPVFLMGMVSPLIISLLSGISDKPGRVAGTVYAVSTLGGIVSTFLFGFIIIPEFGLSKPTMACGILLAVIPLWQLLKRKEVKFIPVFVFALIFSLTQFFKPIETNAAVRVIEVREGILGQLMVTELLPQKDTSEWTGKVLMINRIVQTAHDSRKNHYPYLEYVAQIDRLVSLNKTEKKCLVKPKALLLGLGGGSLANMLLEKGFEVNVCEIDARIYELAQRHFQLSPKVHVTIDDARHFMQKDTNVYDLIVFDVFKGEENPGHVLTLESLLKLKYNLSPEGIMILNNNGYLTGTEGKGSRSLIKTFLKAGYSGMVVPVEKMAKQEDFRNLLMLLQNGNSLKIKLSKTDADAAIPMGELAGDEDLIYTDDKPVMDVLNANASKKWRYYYIQQQLRYFNYLKIPLFQ